MVRWNAGSRFWFRKQLFILCGIIRGCEVRETNFQLKPLNNLLPQWSTNFPLDWLQVIPTVSQISVGKVFPRDNRAQESAREKKDRPNTSVSQKQLSASQLAHHKSQTFFRELFHRAKGARGKAQTHQLALKCYSNSFQRAPRCIDQGLGAFRAGDSEKTTEQNRTEQNRTEQNRQNRTEQTEQNRTEQNRTEQNRTEQNRTEQNRTETEQKQKQETRNKKQETRNKKQETRNKKQETRNKKQETRNKKQETRNKKQETRNKKQETRNKKQETRNKKQETRNKKQETRNKKQETICLFFLASQGLTQPLSNKLARLSRIDPT
ncbi:conserved hypothetical protein [Culex quinquefasciatus]|uniref:Av71 muscle cell intermediate filament n=1 Tax=Culex quinquefasciatus TaxID=7176 RepID=B0WWJ4_CULQU|nr:conserved hypothetical protein [Culex quinquefasciatus]|eukprot:XP_001861766.1 conserved hypothetical protein [Culex quinquefasciatus]